ncbi:unnamed protein product [Cylicostephanus goldi]|uniref:Uncharacterized protein n=1 Tax=Cylicostephanus goldi TaxID=71465 RepID=A0A3P6U479_CYLGO|nr:unnamed protein product [Cylicostephanus goldi]
MGSIQKVQAPAEALAQPNMYAPATPGQEQQQQVMENPEPPKGRLERFRDYLGRTCCSCFLKLPVVVIIVAICIILALLLALIPTIVILTNSERSQSRQTDGLEAGVRSL